MAETIRLTRLGLDANDSSFDNELSVLGKGGFPGVWSELYQVGLDATWEIDVFGGIRRRVEAANDQMQIDIESQQNLMITLFAEVAMDYLELRGTQERIDIAHKNLAAQKEILQLTVSQRKSGLGSELAVTQAAAEVAVTTATIPPLEAASRQLIHALSILLAREPNALSAELEKVEPLPVTPPVIPWDCPRNYWSGGLTFAQQNDKWPQPLQTLVSPRLTCFPNLP